MGVSQVHRTLGMTQPAWSQERTKAEDTRAVPAPHGGEHGPEGPGARGPHHRPGTAGQPYLPPHEDIVPTLQLFVIKVI